MYFKTYLNILEFKVQSSVATLVGNVSNSFLDVSVGNFLLYKTSYTHTLAYLDNQSNCSPIVSIEKFTTNIKCNVVTIRAFFFLMQNKVGDQKTSYQSPSSVLSLEEPSTSVTSQASKTEISTELSSNADTLLLSETTGKAESQEKCFKVKDRVFALWDDCYYPGTITAINEPTDT